MARSQKVHETRLKRCVGKTIRDFQLIRQEDRILVAVSGGKDSWTMLHLLMHFQAVSPVKFELFPVTIHSGYPDFDTETIEQGYHDISPELPWKIVLTNINKTIEKKNSPGKHPCAFCARLRRGALYRIACELNCNRVALGHHADDAIETLLISSMFEGNMVSLPPRLKTTKHPLVVIRPLIRVWEEDIIRYSIENGFPAVSCGHEERSGGIRKYMKKVLANVHRDYPSARRNLLAALHRINPGHFLDNKWL
ncbi:tRNA 2-thiocytidine(32) synthetase TtcA [bacterium]|nr:tRNA 2-thiocytidine(32) synthetase TtcA [bacterium]